MRRNVALAAAIAVISLLAEWGSAAQPVIVQSRVASVKLFTNKAEITRMSRITLKKGVNLIQIEGLPDNLYDWSARGSLPEKYNGKILSMEISRQAMLEKRKKKVVEIEKKLEVLKESDANLADELANILSQEEFLNSVNDFAKVSASKELVTRLPQTGVWASTMDFTSSRRKGLQNSKREIVKKRKELATEMQKWEFELSQIAGMRYFSNYKSLNLAVETNAVSRKVQQYGDLTEQYAQQKGFLESDTSKIDTEKKIILNIFSATDGDTDFMFTYMIPGTYWKMKYDFRASKKSNEVEVILYSDIYQKTGEDWDNINLSLSTGAPLTSIAVPYIEPWLLSAREPYKAAGYGGYASKSKKDYEADEMEGAAGISDYEEKQEAKVPESTVKQGGLFLEVAFPLKQTIESSEKYQKKFIKSYRIKPGSGLKYFYQTVPESSGKVFLMANMTNRTELPWLGGEAQVFLENDYIGKVVVPETPINQEKEIVLGIVPDTVAKKELVKKYDDTSGVFGGNKRIVYSYKITVENSSSESRDVVLLDNFPVAGNDEVKVEVKDLTLKFQDNEETKKSTEYARGIRKFVFTLSPGGKKVITYDAVITYDKELIINGLR